MTESACTRCGCTEDLQEHHLVYRSNGGWDAPDNIEILCRRCHVQLHREAGDYAAWGRGGAEEVLRRRGGEGRAFLAEIGRLGGLCVVNRYGIDYLREIGGRGGQATVERYGHEYMAKLGRRGAAARRAREEEQDARTTDL